MDEKPYDPQELFSEIGLLVSEGRTPVRSAKGREEGPHCPPISSSQREHDCDRHKEQCRKARDFLKLQNILWQNKIPMRVDVLLFPNCEHGYREETIVEGATMSSVDNFELLERWDVQLVKKRSPERLDGFVTGRSHLQAVRSYLHFSQLSSWLISTGGALPHRVVYRAYAPGESVGYSFSRLPEVHNFPSADLGDFVMRTTVAHLPRQDSLLSLVCRSPSPGIEHHLRSRKLIGEDIPSTSTSSSSFNEPCPSTSRSSKYEESHAFCPSTSKNYPKYEESHTFTDRQTHSKDKMEYGKCPDLQQMQQMSQKPPIGRKWRDAKLESQSKLRSERSVPCPVSTTPKRKVDQLSPTMQFQQKQQLDVEKMAMARSFKGESSNHVSTAKSTNIPVIPNKSPSIYMSQTSDEDHFRFSSNVLPGQSLLHTKPSTLSVSTNTVVSSKRLPSPKVLVTGSKRPEPSNFKKRCLDLNPPETVQENMDEFVGFKNVEDFTANDICDLVKPLSPSDLEAYLSSLSNKASKRFGAAKLNDIPTTKCSFFLGEDDAANESNSTGFEKPSTSSGECVDKCVNPSDCVFESQSGIAKRLSNSQKVAEEKPQHVRVLFQKSLSTSEVENQLQYGYSSKQVQTSQNACENIDILQNTCENVEILQNIRENVEVHQNGSKNVAFQQNTCGNVGTQVGSYEIESLDKGLEENCDIPTSCDTGKTPYLRQSKKKCDSFPTSPVTDTQQRDTTPTPSASQRKRTLFDKSIPCSVGGVNVAMRSLMQNLESMDIDDRPCSSPTLDKEVEKHLNQEIASSSADGLTRHDEVDTSSPSQKGLSLCKQLLQKEFQQNVKNEILSGKGATKKSLPSPDDIQNFHFVMGRSASAIFNTNTGLPSRSSPAPIKKKSSSNFDYDCTLTNVRAIKNALSCSKLTLQSEETVDTVEDPKIISTSAPASTNCLLGNFEESVLNGRIEPVGVVDGFSVEIGASGLFCPKHVSLPVASYFFQLSDDNAPSPYLGHVNLEPLGKRGYHIPRIGTVQVTLFNPNRTVVKMFVVMYDLSDMPANCQTFLRQRTLYMPADENSREPSYLRYLIHIRFQSSKSGKIYLHTDIRLIFARDKFEFDPRVANYELRSFTESPVNPKFSPKR